MKYKATQPITITKLDGKELKLKVGEEFEVDANLLDNIEII